MLVETVAVALSDERGEIRNMALGEPVDHRVCGNVAIITSKAGSVRSNHYHRRGWHWLYVVSGKMRYLEKHYHQAEGRMVVRERIVGPGARVLSEPGRAHRTEFLEDTILISLAPAKTHESHEEDLVRVDWDKL